MRTAPDTSNQPETVVTRRVFARRLVTGTVAATVPTVAGAATCGHPTTKPPTSLTWYSWGPEYPLPFTAGPGLNTRVNWMQVANQFAAVASGASGNTIPTPGTGSATPVPTDKLLEQQIEGFVAERNGLTVKVSTERFDRYHEKLSTFAAAGMLPDVIAYDGANALPLLKAGALYPLQRLQGSTGLAFLAGYQPGYIESSMYRGRLYGLPYQARNLVLYVNKSMFSGMSLPPSTWGTPDWTWARFLEVAGQLTRRVAGGGYRQMGTLLTGRPFWASLIRQNGAAEFSKDLSRSRYAEPVVHEALQWASDLVWRYGVAPSEQQNPNGQAFTFDGGTVAMWVWYQHAIPLLSTRNLGFEWDVYPLPSSRQAATYADWSFVSMNTNTTEVDAAWDLMRYLAGPDGDQRALRTGIAAPVVRGSEVRFMTGAAATRNRAAAIQASQQPLAVRPLHESWVQLTGLIDYYLRPVWTGQERAAYAARDLSKALDAVLNGIGLGGPAIGNAPDDA
ncbi:MAG: extracellular solute-binding protein [Chloroflexota bacterium]|jgi:multiple sugar transport system substrate-binding protein